MHSTEKVLKLLDHVHSLSDAELEDAFPLDIIPVPMIRMAIVAIEPTIPQDPAELDSWLEKIVEFATALRSDTEEVTDAPQQAALPAA